MGRRDWIGGLGAALCAGWLSACAPAAPTAQPQVGPGPRDHAVHVVNHGWHTGLALDRAAVVATGLLPEAADFPDARALEFGWGDRGYYTAEEPTAWLAARAALTPTEAVMHVAPVPRPPAPRSPRVERLALSEAEFRRLVEAVSGSFDRPADGAAEPIGAGLAPGARFYPAEGRFHLFETCNTWTARMLAAAGLDVSPSGVVTAGTLMRRVRSATAARAPRRRGLGRAVLKNSERRGKRIGLPPIESALRFE